MTFRMPSDELLSRRREAVRVERRLHAAQSAAGTLACEGVQADGATVSAPSPAEPVAASAQAEELDFEWVGNFPDKSVGYIDPDAPTSIYRGRLQ